ncbi:hypothetical protein ColLi_02808 [Colletotrichum liriopes]|uniref:Uncharacterized protein n=1 Tax=Colletotrichum liriopes TaxID=708192 RepID=A0AA37GFH9_9PEZI|nr:hypothetical protein ColLi_02808 [Colletotrichum liriopes]
MSQSELMEPGRGSKKQPQNQMGPRLLLSLMADQATRCECRVPQDMWSWGSVCTQRLFTEHGGTKGGVQCFNTISGATDV